MYRLHRFTLKSSGVAFLALVAVVALVALSIVACQSTTRADNAISRSEFAAKGLGFTLPASAHEIYYLFHSGGSKDTVFYLRFDIDPADLDSAIGDLLAANDPRYDRRQGYVRLPLSAATVMRPRKDFQPVTWWTPSEAVRGFHVGQPNSDSIRIIVDQDHSRVYFFQNE